MYTIPTIGMIINIRSDWLRKYVTRFLILCVWGCGVCVCVWVGGVDVCEVCGYRGRGGIDKQVNASNITTAH